MEDVDVRLLALLEAGDYLSAHALFYPFEFAQADRVFDLAVAGGGQLVALDFELDARDGFIVPLDAQLALTFEDHHVAFAGVVAREDDRAVVQSPAHEAQPARRVPIESERIAFARGDESAGKVEQLRALSALAAGTHGRIFAVAHDRERHTARAADIIIFGEIVLDRARVHARLSLHALHHALQVIGRDFVYRHFRRQNVARPARGGDKERIVREIWRTDKMLHHRLAARAQQVLAQNDERAMRERGFHAHRHGELFDRVLHGLSRRGEDHEVVSARGRASAAGQDHLCGEFDEFAAPVHGKPRDHAPVDDARVVRQKVEAHQDHGDDEHRRPLEAAAQPHAFPSLHCPSSFSFFPSSAALSKGRERLSQTRTAT